MRSPPNGSCCARSRQPLTPRSPADAHARSHRARTRLPDSSAEIGPAPPRSATEWTRWQARQDRVPLLSPIDRVQGFEEAKPMASWVESSGAPAPRNGNEPKPMASWVDSPGMASSRGQGKAKPMAIWEECFLRVPANRDANRSQWRPGSTARTGPVRRSQPTQGGSEPADAPAGSGHGPPGAAVSVRGRTHPRGPARAAGGSALVAGGHRG